MVICFLALSYKLGEIPPYHTDENFYVESSLRMVESGDFITPVYHEKKRFAKPILYYWIVAASYKVFGVSLVSARLPSALFGTLSIGLIFLLACGLFNPQVGLFSAFILPSIYLHFQIARWSTTDMALSFFILLAVYFFVVLRKTEFQRKIFAYLFYLSMGLGFMVKGPPAILIPGLTVMGFLILTKRKSWFKDLCVAKGLGILAIIILPWFSAMLWMHGDEFKNHIIGNEIKNRIVHGTPFSFYYVGVLFRYQFPWSLFFFFGALRQFGFLGFAADKSADWVDKIKGFGGNIKNHTRQLFQEGRESLAFCYIWIAVCLVLFTLLRIEHSRYMLPGCPAFAMLTAKIFAEAEKNPLAFNVWGFKGFYFISFFILSIFSAAGIFIYKANSAFILFLPVVFLLGAVSIILFFRFSFSVKMILPLSLMLVLTFSFLSGDALPLASRYPMKKFADYIKQENFKGPIGIYELGSHRARLGILTGRTVITLHSPADVEKFMGRAQKTYLVIKESDWKKEFSIPGTEIVHTDQIAVKAKVGIREIINPYNFDKLKEKLNSTETVYFLRNK